jgi:hypothetical protein
MTVETQLHSPPGGGPLVALQTDKKLIDFGFSEIDGARRMVVRVKITAEILTWLEQIGWRGGVLPSPEQTLFRFRAAVIGDLQANTMADGEFVTPELNAPAPAPQPAPPAQLPGVEVPPPAIQPPADDGDDDEDEPEEPPAPTIHQAPAFSPPPMRAMVVIELAHKIAAEGQERGPGTWAVPVRDTYYLDGRTSQMANSREAAFMPNRDRTLAALTKSSLDWLAERHAIVVENGRPELGDVTLALLQTEYGFKPDAESGGPYSTYWLNPVLAAPAPAAPAPASPVPESAGEAAPSAEAPRRDTFSSQIVGLAAERRAISALAAATRQAEAFIASLRSRTKSPKAEEIDPIARLLAGALEAVQPYLDEEAA